MTVLHIVSSISRVAGGPARSSQGLVAALERNGVNAWLMSLKERGTPYVSGIKHFLCPGLEGWMGVREAVERSIETANADLVHIHSIWQLSLHQAAVAGGGKVSPIYLHQEGLLRNGHLDRNGLKRKSRY